MTPPSTPRWQNDRWDVEDFWPRRASKGELMRLRKKKKTGHNQSFFILHCYISGGRIGMRGGSVSERWPRRLVFGEEQSGKTTNGSSALFLNLDTPIRLLLPPVYSLFLYQPIFHPLPHPSYCFFFFLLLLSVVLPPLSCLLSCISLLFFPSAALPHPSPLLTPLSLSLSPCSSCLFGHGPISPIGLVAV